MKMLRVASSTLSLGALLALSAVPVQAMPTLPTISNVAMVQSGVGHWHGYRGSRTERPGTRRYADGYWYPFSAFGVAAGTTGSIVRHPAKPIQRQTYCQGTFGGTNGDGSMPCDNGY
ncbi:surface protein [Rhizobium sp. Root1220]|uniref:surface protein n=1 Tax=Rhizobium sp. Root1220 TaxID=1736432 RepID=UPI0009EA3044|nr:surface protein [Rhizobium sp. Root1220]